MSGIPEDGVSKVHFADLIDIEWIDTDPEHSRARVEIRDELRQPFGLMHGGVMSSLVESICSFATAAAVHDEGMAAMGQSINVSFMRPIADGHVNALARVRRRGRTAWNWEVEITDDDGRLCALLRATIAVRDAPARLFRAGAS